jgi:hypothetical protein
MKWSLLPLALVIPLTSACSPPHMYQRATIRIEDGQACFSINDTKETRRTTPSIDRANVQIREGGSWRDVWRWHVPYPSSIPLRPDQCIPYGFRGPPGTSEISEPLRPNTPYSADIGGEVPNPYPGGDSTIQRLFLVEFCVRNGPHGREIVLVPQGKDGGRQWEVCETQDTPAIPGTLRDADS